MRSITLVAAATLAVAFACSSAPSPRMDQRASPDAVAANPVRPPPVQLPDGLHHPQGAGALVYLGDVTDAARAYLANYRRTPLERNPGNDTYRICVKDIAVFGAKRSDSQHEGEDDTFRDTIVTSVAKELGARREGDGIVAWKWVVYKDMLDGFTRTLDDGSQGEVRVLNPGHNLGDLERLVAQKTPGYLPVLSLRSQCPLWWLEANTNPERFDQEFKRHNEGLRTEP
ncbi:MAG: hypothetical protein GY811_07380 [Myxococcales bacterium]|nr:hypothetical protein [Myxococcales bacterium]